VTRKAVAVKWLSLAAGLFGADTPAAGDPVRPLVDDSGHHWSVPVTADRFNPSQLDDPHHDYPAWDLMLPEGTPIYAITDGRVVSVYDFNANWWRAGCRDDLAIGCHTCGVGVTVLSAGALRTTYCHNSRRLVELGQDVTADQQLAVSGDTGRSGAPHVHIEFRRDGVSYCPQPIMQALYENRTGPLTWTTQGCSF
jgi:murein DD-endopeptidase MepM/ murein hydrolase activator NlpD